MRCRGILRRGPGRFVIAGSACLVAGGCSGPPLDHAAAAAQIAARLPGAAVEIVRTEDDGELRIVAVEASGEPLRFAFRLQGDAWRIDRFEDASGTLVDLEAATEAWRDLLRTPREVTLASLATVGRPDAPIEILVTGLRIESISEKRIVLVDASGTEPLPVRIEGGNLDRLPLQPGLDVSVQVGDLERQRDAWQPLRPQPPAEVLPLLEQLEVVMLQMLKIRHANAVVPIPYR